MNRPYPAFRFCDGYRRILPVKFPLPWVIDNVLSDPLQGFVIANDMLIIIALPQCTTS